MTTEPDQTKHNSCATYTNTCKSHSIEFQMQMAHLSIDINIIVTVNLQIRPWLYFLSSIEKNSGTTQSLPLNNRLLCSFPSLSLLPVTRPLLKWLAAAWAGDSRVELGVSHCSCIDGHSLLNGSVLLAYRSSSDVREEKSRKLSCS